MIAINPRFRVLSGKTAHFNALENVHRTSMDTFVHLEVQSAYSFLWGTFLAVAKSFVRLLDYFSRTVVENVVCRGHGSPTEHAQRRELHGGRAGYCCGRGGIEA